jgi:hypothetical protein
MSRYHHAGAKGEKRYSSYSVLTSALDGVSGQGHKPEAIYSRERTPPITHWRGGYLDLRAGLDTEARKHLLPLPGMEPRLSVTKIKCYYQAFKTMQ